MHDIENQTAKDKYRQNNPIKFDTESIKSSICDYCDAFILHDYLFCVIKLTADNDRAIVFKNYASFLIWKTEIDDVFTDKGKHIYIAMPMYNYIECSDNYSDTSRRLWQLERIDVTNNNANLTADNSYLFKYKAALVEKTSNAVNNTNSSLRNTKIVAPLNV